MQRFLVPKFYIVYTLDGINWESWSTELYDFFTIHEEISILKSKYKLARMIAQEVDWYYVPEHMMHKIYTN